MKNCWKILDIEETTDVDIIRRAYLALLPSFHPETDPQGFKQLRQAYEEALRIVQSPAKSVWQPEEYEVAEHEILLAFRALLASDSERFLPSAWQRFIQQLNYCSMEEIDELRWSLCTIAMNTAHLSFECVVLLAERLRWLQEENTGEIDEEELESFLYAIAKGNVFNFQTILHLPVAVQNDTIDFYQMFARIWSSHPQWLTLYLAQHRAVIIPMMQNCTEIYSAGIAQVAWISPNFWITPSHGGKLNLIMKMRLIMNTRNASIVEKAKACWQNFVTTGASIPPPRRML